MCLINFHFQQHPHYKLIVAANRDEFYQRPTDYAHNWSDYPMIIAGRDLKMRGTWLGITKEGHFAALTNYRAPAHMTPNENSRGALVTDFLIGNETPEQYIASIKQDKHLYNGFNLLLGNPDCLFYYNNIENEGHIITEGTHGLSNHFLNTPWPKVVNGKKLLQNYVTEQEKIDPEILFTILRNDRIAKEEELPSTGVERSLERQLSPLFINMEDYGTRCSTVLLVTKENNVHFIERSYHKGKFINEENFEFTIIDSNRSIERH